MPFPLCSPPAALLAALLATGPATRPARPAGFDPARHLALTDVRPGMTGYGLSVFHGNTVDRFDVRVVSVLRRFNPNADVILIRFGNAGVDTPDGTDLARATAISGMSGSPIYLYDDQHHPRLCGAFAYGWPMQKDPVAGVQPIEYMLALGGDAPPPPTTAPAAGGRWSPWDDARPARPRTATPSRLVPLATPVMVGGVGAALLERTAPLLATAGLVPVPAATNPANAQADDDPIVPGAVLGVPLVTGDVEMTAIGTCTDVIGDRVLAFGHPLNGDGPAALPFGGGQIQGVIASVNSSFKIGSLGRVRGTITFDGSAGVAGRLGPAPATIPVELTVAHADASGPPTTYRFAVARHPKLTPSLLPVAMAAALTADRELPARHTLGYDLTVDFPGGQRVRLSDRAVDGTGADWAAVLAGPLSAAADNPFAAALPDRVAGTITVADGEQSARILYATVPRGRYRPGQTVTAAVTCRPFRGDATTLPVSIPIPRDLPDGTYQLTVSDATQYLDDERTAEPFRFTADTAAGVFDVLRELAAVRHDAVYARLVRQPDSVAVGRVALAKLPGSRRRILLGSGRSDVTPFVSSAHVVVPARWVMAGSAELEVVVDRRADVQP